MPLCTFDVIQMMFSHDLRIVKQKCIYVVLVCEFVSFQYNKE
jgi:hypothetical protein